MKTDKLWKIFSLYIRLRDCIKFSERYCNGEYTPYAKCCSCGAVKHYKNGDAGHFINRTHLILKYDERNVNFQCKQCNAFKQGNYADYREFMIIEYGIADVLELELMKKRPYKMDNYTKDHLIEMYSAKVKNYKKTLGIS